jgi:hypothetical protein
MSIVCAGNKSASGKIVEGAGTLLGIVVSSSSSLTLKVYDNVAGSGAVMMETTAAITAPFSIPIMGEFANGLFVTVGGSGNFAVIYER